MCDALGADIDYRNMRVVLFGPMRHPYPCAGMAIYQCHDGFEIGSDGAPSTRPWPTTRAISPASRRQNTPGNDKT